MKADHHDGWDADDNEGRAGSQDQASLARARDGFVPTPPDFADEVLVTTVPLTPRTELRARLQTWKGERRLDIRAFSLYKGGEWGPTQRGISLPLERAGDLLKAVRLLHEAAEREVDGVLDARIESTV